MRLEIRELSMDILRQSQHVEVLEPQELRGQLTKELKATLNNPQIEAFEKEKIED